MNISIFKELFSSEGHKAPASEIGRSLGFRGKNTSSPLNSEIGRYAKRIAKKYEIEFTIRSTRKLKFWDLFFNGWDDAPFFFWELRPELVEALKQTGLKDEKLFPDELTIDDTTLN